MDTSNTYGVFSPPGSKTHPQFIKFIDSEYRELFKIPDGANIKITYPGRMGEQSGDSRTTSPPGDDRGERVHSCHYIDDHHFRLGGETLHTCQFAEILERIGAKFEPEIQLPNVEVVPFAPGEEKYCTYNREEGNTCVGHIAGDFGQSGDRFFSSWYNHKTKSEADWSGVTPEFQAELHSAMYALRQGLLKDHSAMLDFCQSRPEAKLSDRNGLEHYGFKLDTDARQYFILCIAEQYSRDARFIVYAYDDAPAREHEKPSVLKQIRDAQKAPKAPRKAKTPGRKKNGEEL